jgi:putative hemolysin
MLLEFAVILALVLLNGVFAGAEIALISVRRTRLHELVESKRRGARAAQALREKPERLLATVQVGITVVGTSAAAFGGETLARDLAPVLAYLPGLGRYATQLSLALVVVFISFLSLVLGELVPKSLALRAAESYALLIAGPLLALARLARPLVWVLTASSNAVLRLFGDQTSFSEARLSPDELRELVDEAGRAGALDARTSEIAARALDFRDLTAEEVMVPRMDIVAVPLDASPEELLSLALGRKHARVPVYRDAPDDIQGYVALKDLLAPAMRGEKIHLEAMLRPLHFVPETARATELLKDLQRRRAPLAIVVDETGAVAGLVTLTDLLEELVGEIITEHDQEPVAIQREPSGAALVLATTPVRDVNRELSLELPEGEGYSTLAGLCIHLAQRIPEQGARLRVADGTVLEVVEASARRVRTVRVWPAALAPA